MSAVIVVATMWPEAGSEGEVEKALRAAVRSVHSEPGCLRYSLHRSIGDPVRFVMIEKWESEEALDAHGRAPALRELGAQLDGKLAAPPEVTRLAALPEGDATVGAL